MFDLIRDFPDHLKEALTIGRSAKLGTPNGPYTNVVVTGLGGSGIGGRIAAQAVAAEASCPSKCTATTTCPCGQGSL